MKQRIAGPSKRLECLIEVGLEQLLRLTDSIHGLRNGQFVFGMFS